MIQTETIAAGQPLTLSAPFPAQSVRVDNLSNQWYQVDGLPGGYVSPYTAGWTAPLSGAGSVSLVATAPPSTQQPTANVGETVTVTLSSDPQPASDGQSIPPGGAPSGFFTLRFQPPDTNTYQLDTFLAARWPTGPPLRTARQILVRAAPTNSGTVYVSGSIPTPIGVVGPWPLGPADAPLALSVGSLSLVELAVTHAGDIAYILLVV